MWSLVHAIGTIGFTIALPAAGYTAVVTAKLIHLTARTTIELIASMLPNAITAIIIAITAPGGGNASFIGATELIRGTGGRCDIGTIQFIGAIWAIGIAVTAPARHDADGAIGTVLEEGITLLTGSLLALFLIAKVSTITHIIAEIFTGNAFATAATEVIRWTLAERRRLIATIATLLLAIACLILGNATMILAHEMRLGTFT